MYQWLHPYSQIDQHKENLQSDCFVKVEKLSFSEVVVRISQE